MATRLRGIKRFIVVRSLTTADAVVRLQSEPILQGLRARCADVVLHTGDPAVPLTIDQPTCILFHYSDEPAVELVRSLPNRDEQVVVCLACDIYSYRPYIDLHQFVDFFLVPTELHGVVLASQIYKPVYVLPECVDPIALGTSPQARQARPGRRVLWFGYSESFMKSMASLMPIILDHRRLGTIESFTLMVDRENLLARHGNPFGLELFDFDGATFFQQAQSFDYAILSHFALDLTINSYIKSANKAVTSLVAGLVPLCSDTPNYRALLEKYDLGQFKFSSPAGLDALLRRLDPAGDAAATRRSGAAADLVAACSGSRICDRFVLLLNEHLAGERHSFETLRPEPLPPERPRLLRLKEHLRDLVPSAGRSAREWLERRPS